jgi:hypothetical protein
MEIVHLPKNGLGGFSNIPTKMPEMPEPLSVQRQRHCFMLPKLLDVWVVYVHMPTVTEREQEAIEFVASYQAYKAEYIHRLLVVCNGHAPTDVTRAIFRVIPGVSYLTHDNSGWDIGAYQAAAQKINCDLMMFLGTSTLIRGDGWLRRFIDVYDTYGPGIYGAMANQKPIDPKVFPHIRTTGFILPPRLMNEYPKRIKTVEGRYPFEHGRHSLTRFVLAQGLPAMMVTWDGEYDMHSLDQVSNGMHRGKQENLIMWDRLCRPPHYNCPA